MLDYLKDDYNLNSLVETKPANDDFAMFVTPRYKNTYEQGYEYFSTRVFKNQIRSADLLIDIGANYGYYSLLGLSTNPDLRVIAVEPIEENFSVLNKNVKQNAFLSERVKLVNAAVTSKSGKIKFYKSEASDNSSVLKHPNSSTLAEIEVDAVTVDDLIENENISRLFIKSDTDGNELEVLKGLQKTFERYDEITLLIEVNPKMLKLADTAASAIVDFLKERGFYIYGIDDTKAILLPFTLKQNQIMMDAIFTKSYYNILCVKKKTQPLSVVFFSHSSNLMGAERSLLDMIGGLQSRGVFCTTVVPNSGVLNEKLTDLGCGVITLDQDYNSWWWANKDNEVKRSDIVNCYDYVVNNLVHEIEMIKPDCIYSQTIVSPWGAVVANKLGIPHFLSVREYGELDHGLHFYYGFNESLLSFYNDSSYIFAISSDVKNTLFPDDPDSKISVIYSKVDFDAANNHSAKPLDDGSCHIGIFGSISIEKGQKDFVASCIDLLKKHKNIVCHIIGMPVDQLYYNEIVDDINISGFSDNFVLHGYTSDPYSIMLNMNIVISCSRKEALGRTLIESTLSGKPVIYANDGGPKELFKDKTHGLSYEVNNSHDLSEKIEMYLDNYDYALQLAKNAKEHILSTLTDENYSGKVYNKLLSIKESSMQKQNHKVGSVENLLNANKIISDEVMFRPVVYYSDNPDVFSENDMVKGNAVTFGYFDLLFELPNNGYKCFRFDPIESFIIDLEIYQIIVANDDKEITLGVDTFYYSNYAEKDTCFFKFLTLDPNIVFTQEGNIKSLVIRGKITKRDYKTAIVSCNQQVTSLVTKFSSELGRISTLLYDTGDGYNTDNIVTRTFEAVPNTVQLFDLNCTKKINSIRYDPWENHFGQVRLHEIQIEYLDGSKYQVTNEDLKYNGELSEGGWIDFITLDPIIEIAASGEIKNVLIEADYILFNPSQMDLTINNQRSLISKCKQESEIYINEIGYISSLLFDTGNGFNDQEQVSFAFNGVLDRLIKFEINCDKEIQALRFDPWENHFGLLNLSKVQIVLFDSSIINIKCDTLSYNGELNTDGWIEFKTIDPMVFIPVKGCVKAVIIELETVLFSAKQTELTINEERLNTNNIIQKKDSEIQKKDSEIQKKDSEIQKKDSEIQKKDSEIQKKDSDLTCLRKLDMDNQLKIKMLLSSERERRYNEYNKRKVFRKVKDFFKYVRNPRTMKKWKAIKSLVKSSGLFDSKYYLSTNQDLYLNCFDPLEHFCRKGYREGRNPSVLFDVKYYLETNPDVKKTGVNPLAHFIQSGWKVNHNPTELFDVKYYLETNPDVKESGVNPLAHFIKTGWKGNRKPTELFDVKYYLEANPDVKGSGVNPLVHFIQSGWKENRKPTELFDVKYYLETNPDVKESGVNPLVHFIQSGWKENRKPTELFDVKYYLEANPDVKESGVNPLVHFIQSGWKENRKPTELFDVKYYLETNPDVKDSGVNPLAHFIQSGWKENRKPTELFDVKYYLETNPDVKESGVNPLVHFIQSGWKENRRPTELFDVKYYLEANPDVKKAGINPLSHYVEIGYLEKRSYVNYDDIGFNYGHFMAYIHQNVYCNKIVIVSHDATQSGAPFLALNIAKNLQIKFGYRVVIILLSGGILENEFRNHGFVINLQCTDRQTTTFNAIFSTLYINGFRNAICNTVVSGSLVPLLKNNKFEILSLIHELPKSISLLNAEESSKNMIELSDHVVFPANYILNAFRNSYSYDYINKISILPQGLFRNHLPFQNKESKDRLRRKLRIKSDSRIVLSCGTADFRKGIDVFYNVFAGLQKHTDFSDVHFVWVGPVIENYFYNWMMEDLRLLGFEENIHFVGYSEDIDYFAGADIFFLSSREDPFPSVVLDAMACGIPVIAFDQSGGAPEALENNCGEIIPYLDVDKVISSIIKLLKDSVHYDLIVSNACNKVNEKYNFEKYISELLSLFSRYKLNGIKLPSVSVVIPNYNYSPYLQERLTSVINQTLSPCEILFLDDASTDDSVQIAESILRDCNINYRIICNEANKGCFSQWVSGIEQATGDLIWIAEADDKCRYDFLERILPCFSDEEVMLAFCQSEIIDSAGTVCQPTYYEYTKDVFGNKPETSYKNSGDKELNDGLAIKNTIPNASAVVFRKSSLAGVKNKLLQFKSAGDWFAYIYALKMGSICFIKDILNSHRRHSSSIIDKTEKSIQFYNELVLIQKEIIDNHFISDLVFNKSVLQLHDELLRLKSIYNEGINPQQIDFIDTIKGYEDKVFNQKVCSTFVIVAPDFEFGGGQEVAINQSNFLAKFNKVILYNARPDLYDQLFLEKISSDVEIAKSKGTPEDLLNLCNKLNDIVIISHIWWSDKLVWKLRSSSNLEFKWLIVMHGCYEMLIDNPACDVDFNRYARDVLETADQVLYTAEKNKSALDRIAPNLLKPALKINNGVDASKRNYGEFITREDYEIKDSSFVFGLCARAIPEKGWEFAIEAVNKINEDPTIDTPIYLFLIGDGDYAQKLKNKHESTFIRFVGFQKDICKWLNLIDCILLPTYFISESQPMIIIDSLSQGTPVIATDIGEVEFMIEDDNGNKAGLLVKLLNGKPDTTDLICSMKKFVLDTDGIYSQSKTNCILAFKKYEMKTVMEKYCEVISEI